MTRLDFCLAHAAQARREAARLSEPELVRRARNAEAAWSRMAEGLQQARPPR